MDFCLSHFESLTPTNWLDPPKFGFSEWWIQHQVNPLGKSSTKNSGLAISYQSATSPRYAKKTKPCRFNGGWEKTSPCVGRCRLARLGPETVFETWAENDSQMAGISWVHTPISGQSVPLIHNFDPYPSSEHLDTVPSVPKTYKLLFGPRAVFSRAGIVRLCYTYCMEMHH